MRQEELKLETKDLKANGLLKDKEKKCSKRNAKI